MRVVRIKNVKQCVALIRPSVHISHVIKGVASQRGLHSLVKCQGGS